MSKIPEAGARIRLLAMPDDPAPLPRGSLGTVTGGSNLFSGGDWVQIFVKWDDGSTLSLSVPPDIFEVVT